MSKTIALIIFICFSILLNGCQGDNDTDIPQVQQNDEEAEILSLEGTKELVAPDDVYFRVLSDLSGIRATYSDVANISATPSWDPQSLLVWFDDETMPEVRTGEYDDWNDLNENYGANIEFIYSSLPGVALKFERNYYVPLLIEDYNKLRGETHATEDHIAFIGEDPPNDVCLAIDQHPYYYVFSREGALEAAFQTNSEGNIIEVDLNEIDVNQTQPSWFESCLEWLILNQN